MYNDVVTLVLQTRYVNEYGDWQTQETQRDVFVRAASIGQTEFYQAAATGLKPELKFVMADYLDYRGEEKVIYRGVDYRVLRTYRSGQEFELVCTRGVESPADGYYITPPTPHPDPEEDENANTEITDEIPEG